MVGGNGGDDDEDGIEMVQLGFHKDSPKSVRSDDSPHSGNRSIRHQQREKRPVVSEMKINPYHVIFVMPLVLGMTAFVLLTPN